MFIVNVQKCSIGVDGYTILLILKNRECELMKQENPYILKNFMYRFPSLGLDAIEMIYFFDKEKLEKNERINKMLSNEKFKTAIRTASPQLYEACIDLYKKEAKDIKSIYFSLLKYYIRMFSRPTPFSTFSNVGMGVFKEDSNNSITLDTSKQKYKIRISHEWIYKFISKVENDRGILKNLVLKSNKLLIEISDKYHLSYFTDGANKENHLVEEVSLKKNNLLNFVLSNFEEEKKVSDFLKILNEATNNEILESKALDYILELIKKDFLISELKFSNSIDDPIHYLHEKLVKLENGNHYYSDILTRIMTKINSLNNLNFNYVSLNSIENFMKKIEEATEYIHIDSYYSQEVELNNSLIKDLEKLSQTIIKLSSISDSNKDYMDYYLRKFIDYYGIYNAVKLKDLLEDKTELGPPPTYTNPVGLLEYDYHKQKKEDNNSFLKQILYQSLIKGDNELDITDYLNNSPLDIKDIPSTSLDLYFSIYAESSEELSNNNYTIYPSGNIASPFAGKTMGRFLDIFPVQQEVINTEIYDRESNIQFNEELTNINIQPIKGKYTNVMSASNKFNYEVSIASTTNSSKNAIEIDDIYIFSDGMQFHLISKSKDKLVFPITSHMANHQFGMPNIYRFLLDLAAYKRAAIIPFNWGEFEELPYLPKLKSGNLVIQNKLWNIDVRKEAYKDMQTLSKLVKNFFTTYKVPRYIKIIDFDNYLFIDTHSESMFELFINELSKKKFFQFIDADEIMNTSILSDKHTYYVNEIICSSFFDNINKPQLFNQRPLSYYSKENRFKDLGKEWLYLKLYHPNNIDNDLLIYYIPGFIQRNKLENHFYFIRYADPYPHIRLRIKVGNQLLIIIERINEMISILRRKKLIINATFDGYNREIERYGGQYLIKYAENIFCKDSLLILNLLPAIKKSKTELEYYSLITLDILLKSYLGKECSFNWLEKNMNIDKKYYKDYRKLFKENKNKYFEVVKEINFTISSEIKDLNKLIQNYSNKYIQIHSNKEYFNQIVLSFLHMHLNRYGIHSEREQRIMNFLYFMKKEDYMKDKKR